ncbi:GDSL-type esterase/lipase family protein [Halarcobacter sp.]|uniref:GDSL-type esterase/lipase family protein n=1 Tax=Halarcobacter sp. TaxID=2321133 RepID=UPI0029F4F243|nr:GDSL-type esterase/lipase family protein [Halarcobacter sp.]
MKKNIEVVLLGDSIIARGDWNKLLEKEHLLNLGIDGDTTKGVLERIDLIKNIEPKTIVLMIGVNDLCLSIPLDEVFENYKKILKILQESNANILVNGIFITQMPAVNKKVLKLNSMIEEYCKKNSLKFLDLNESFENEKKLLKENLTTDGLHLGQAAYKAWAYKLNSLI